MFLLHKQMRPFQGIALGELILVLTVIVSGISILLAILVGARANTINGQNQIAMENQARMVVEEVQALLQSSVHPASLDLATSASLKFKANECSIISSSNFNGKDFYLTTIQTVNASHPNLKNNALQKKVEIYTSILDPDRTIDKREHKRFIGIDPDRYSCSVQFEYACSTEEALDLKPFQHELAAEAYPRVIRIRVHVEPIAGKRWCKQASYNLTTAVRVL